VGRQHDVWQFAQSFGQARLEFVDVQARAGQPSLAKGGHQGRFVHERPPGGIDENGAGLHGRQGGRIKDVLRLGRQRRVDAHDVALGQKIRQGQPGGAKLPFQGDVGFSAAAIDHGHGESPGHEGHGRTDAAGAENAEGFARDFGPQKQERPPAGPGAGAGGRVGRDHVPGHGEKQGPGHFGRGDGQHVRGVGHRHPAFGGFGHVDIVEADGIVGIAAELWRGIEKAGIDAVGQLAEDAVGIPDAVQQFVPGQRPVLGVDPNVAGIAQYGQADLGNPSGNHHVVPFGHGVRLPFAVDTKRPGRLETFSGRRFRAGICRRRPGPRPRLDIACLPVGFKRRGAQAGDCAEHFAEMWKLGFTSDGEALNMKSMAAHHGRAPAGGQAATPNACSHTRRSESPRHDGH